MFGGADGSVVNGPLPPLWTAIGSISCNAVNRLYCFSTVITIFWDGFELTGDFSRWSMSIP